MIDPRLDEQAAEWFLLRQSDALAGEQARAFDAWIANPSALEAYRYAERAWLLVGGRPDKAANSTSSRSRARGLFLAAAGIAASLAVIFTPASTRVAAFIDDELAPMRGGGQVIATGDGDRTTRRLADGTIVTLDGGTRMRVLEMGARRRIALIAGHAFFNVAKDPAHPFLVTAMDKTVHAVGTAFDVRVEPNAVAVTLVEGKVRVDQPRGLLREPIAADLTPGKQLIASDSQVWLMSQVNTTEATSWLKDRLTYTEGTISQIVADVNAGSTRKIVFLQPVDDRQRIVGGFKPGDVETLASILEVKGIAQVVSRSEDRIEMIPSPR